MEEVLLTPKYPMLTAEMELIFPPSDADIGRTLGGFVATSEGLISGKISINAAQQRILMGLATSPTNGVGIFMGSDQAASVGFDFRVGDPSGNYMWWDASAATLTIVGSITGSSINIPDATSPLFSVNSLGEMTAQSATILASKISTTFEKAERFAQVVAGTGSTTFGQSGLVLATGGTAGSYAYSRMEVTAFDVKLGNPTVSMLVIVNIAVASHDDTRYVGLGDIGTTPDYNVSHIGFKIRDAKLYATTGSGSAETETLLTTLSNGDVLDLIFKVHTGTSVDFYYRKNVSSFAAKVTISTNLPAGNIFYLLGVANNGTYAQDLGMKLVSFVYER